MLQSHFKLPAAMDRVELLQATVEGDRSWRLVITVPTPQSGDDPCCSCEASHRVVVLLAIGLAISIPMVIAGSAIILALLERFPILVWGGAAILGWVAGDILASDPIVEAVFPSVSPAHLELFAQIIGALFVVTSGYVWRRRHHVSLEEA